MDHDIANLQTISERARAAPVNNRVTDYYDNKEQKPLSRNALQKLHANPEQISMNDLRDTAVAKGFNLASNGIQQSLSSGLNALSTASGGLINIAKNNANNNNLKSILFGILGSIFGLSSLKGILGIPSLLKSKDSEDKQAPILIKGAQWVAGGAIALGVFRGLAGGAIISNPALMIGIASFLVLRGIISAYENEHSPISKLLEMLGIREQVKELTNTAKLDELVSS